MLITFLNVPFDVCWNEEIIEKLLGETELFMGYEPRIETYRLKENQSHVHVIVSEIIEACPWELRVAIAKQIFLFLKYHALLEGSDIYFANFPTEPFDEHYFEPLDVEIR